MFATETNRSGVCLELTAPPPRGLGAFGHSLITVFTPAHINHSKGGRPEFDLNGLNGGVTTPSKI